MKWRLKVALSLVYDATLLRLMRRLRTDLNQKADPNKPTFAASLIYYLFQYLSV